jgi:hypothetical protein
MPKIKETKLPKYQNYAKLYQIAKSKQKACNANLSQLTQAYIIHDTMTTWF